jgi:fused signal recognition particle receptor
MGLFEKLKTTLSKTRHSFGESINTLVSNFRAVDEDFLEELEETLIMADAGVEVTESIIDELRKQAKTNKISSGDHVRELLMKIIAEKMPGENLSLRIDTKPSVIMVIGVNGTGKTTTCAKLAKFLQDNGKDVLLAAGDTFRAAASEQLDIWAKRINIEIVKHREGGDPAAVLFDAIQAAKARGKDVIVCDTAGRLHNKKHLMDELSKMSRVIDRELPDADKEFLLVIDATTGQNAINQAKEFADSTGLTGIVLTKLDGTARGGMAIGVLHQLGIPIKFVGLGEGAGDFDVFSPENYAKGLLE